MMPLANPRPHSVSPKPRGSVGTFGIPGVYSQYMHLPLEAPFKYLAWELSFIDIFK